MAQAQAFVLGEGRKGLRKEVKNEEWNLNLTQI